MSIKLNHTHTQEPKSADRSIEWHVGSAENFWNRHKLWQFYRTRLFSCVTTLILVQL